MNDVSLRLFGPNDAAWLVQRHGALYAQSDGFDDTFAPLVAGIIATFLADHDPGREAGWVAERNGRRLGSIFCVAAGPSTARLRLFLLEPDARGVGLGKRLLNTCTAFARSAGYRDMMLWTHESHRAACALYRAAGWQMANSRPVHSFGVDLIEQHWSVTL